MSLLEIPVSVNKTRWPLSSGVTLDRTSFAATRSVCLEVALARPCTISVVTGPAPKFSAATRRVSMTPGKGGDDTDNPLHFSGEIKDWPTFKGNDPVSRRRPRHSVTPRGRTGASVVLCHEFFFSSLPPTAAPRPNSYSVSHEVRVSTPSAVHTSSGIFAIIDPTVDPSRVRTAPSHRRR